MPKDGPSAGITMVTALASLASGRPVHPELGMTGEVTLAGRVLPIGGVKQKLLAAHRAGLTEVIIPARNEPDLDDLPEEVRAGLTIHALSRRGRRAGDRPPPAERHPGRRRLTQPSPVSVPRKLGTHRSGGSKTTGTQLPARG